MSTSDWIATGAFIVSALSLLWTIRSQNRQGKTDKRLRAVEEQLAAYELEEVEARRSESLKARMTVDTQYVSGWKEESLVLTNHGPSTARKVSIWIDGVKPKDNDTIIRVVGERLVLEPGQFIVYNLVKNMATPDSLNVEVNWDDDFETGRRMNFVVPI